ncbi:aminoglycoside phosphotransferase family protein [Chelativorans sp. M5D2P16]|uniref:phosphotransferase family protein n=1 Tax=Chelativorans sp. M5D2P16 TaxID=3095678 RepID=UPI002ACA2DC3|nr:aminoglycoside phosphotransferase family protein [Chelativorans sp. M5D2P16]MDZ5695887.1 aminoglycoside phosphotransferase family protein [Chelativorans sp. M5D2P16]
MAEAELESLKRLILDSFPELSGASFTLLSKGWDSTGVDVDNRWIFKFPRHAEAERALVREARLLAVIRPAVSVPVPELAVQSGPPLFSRHEKLQGDHLVTADYDRLEERDRQRLASRIALFYAELHALDRDELAAAGAEPIEPWLAPEKIRAKAIPVLPSELRSFAERTLAGFEEMGADPCGSTYGFFDGHGWNMAFDHETSTLNGIYDFGDSGFGDLHQEFIYTNFISRDLTARVVSEYEKLTGQPLDRRRIDVLTGTHRLSELAELADDRRHVGEMIESVARWASTPGCREGSSS